MLNKPGNSSDNKLMSNIATSLAMQQAATDKIREAVEEEPVMDDVEAWRQRRLEEMKQQKEKIAENVAKRSHGEYREVTQDEFLPAVTGSDKVVCHFYHDDFQRCKILDQHLRILAQAHLETRFISINAEKAPFFVERLQIRVLPTLVIFEDGKAINRVIGFEGVSNTDSFATGALAKCLIKRKAIVKKSEESSSDSDED